MNANAGADDRPERPALARRVLGRASAGYVALGSVAALSLCITVWAFLGALELDEERRDAHFARETERVVAVLMRRMERYEDALQAGVAALDVEGGRMDRGTWNRFARGLDFTRRYPGVNGIGLVERVAPDELDALERRMRAEGAPDFEVHPEVEADVHLPIIYIEPASINRAAIGLDLAHERHRREAAETAFATGMSTITGPIVLVQDALRQPGFLFYTPYFGSVRRPDSGDAMDGFVYSPFVVAELFEGALGSGARDVDVRARDGDTVLHDEFTGRVAGADGRATTVELPLYGRRWELDVRTNALFDPPDTALAPLRVLAVGLLASAMIVGLFLSILRAREALKRTKAMGAELAARTEQLEASNRELERFACVVSHDLKTPLRGIGDLAWYLEEDLEPMIASGAAPAEVPRHLERIGVQTRRMDSLIDGILEYSGIGRRGEQALEAVDVAALLGELAEVHSTHAGRLLIEGPLPVLETSRTRLEQVLGNLVGNAFKYHHAPESALVRVSFEPRGALWRIRVADDGPGIDPAYHERIFEMFQTLEPKDAVDSTGVGLAIVRRTAEQIGGRVWVESAVGAGTTFVVDWPARTLSHGTGAHPAPRDEHRERPRSALRADDELPPNPNLSKAA